MKSIVDEIVTTEFNQLKRWFWLIQIDFLNVYQSAMFWDIS